MRCFCFNDIKMRHLKNRSLVKCLILYQFVNLKLFHPEQRDFEIRDHLLFLISLTVLILLNSLVKLDVYEDLSLFLGGWSQHLECSYAWGPSFNTSTSSETGATCLQPPEKDFSSSTKYSTSKKSWSREYLRGKYHCTSCLTGLD
jgi:hypothetical protein